MFKKLNKINICKSVDNYIQVQNNIISIDLKILSYNIHGLENKILYNDFFNYINSFDIVILLETHICEEKFENFKNYFKNLNIFWKPAHRVSRYGRAIGGCLYGINKNLNQQGLKCTLSNNSGLDIINIKTVDTEIKIYPLYLRSANWEEDFGLVESFFNENGAENGLVVGDLNVRIGEMQQMVEEEIQSWCPAFLGRRKSKDAIINGKGKKFMELCEDYGLVVLNGAIKGDEDGNFTFMSRVGDSVNDICATSLDILPYVNEFFIDDKIWSDHQPINFILNVNIKKSPAKSEKLLPKLKWYEKEKDKYIESVKTHIRQIKENNTDIDLSALINIIRNSTQQNKSESAAYVPKTLWFNWKCHNARKKSFKLLKKYKKSNNNDDKQNYLLGNIKYKEICKESQLKYYKELEFKLNSVNDSKTWWKLAREIRNQPHSTILNVSTSEFRIYFRDLLNPIQIPSEISYAPLLIVDSFLDSEITTSDIMQILNKVKINKAPGEDRVPYEFFKNAPTELLIELAACYNHLYTSMRVDETFTLSIIYPIFKKGNANLACNYRGISFMNCVAKILMGIINDRLYKWAEQHRIVTEYQAGFRKGYSPMDNIYNLAAIVNLKFTQKKKVFAFFVDFKAAFDKVSRKSLIYKLHTLGVSTKMVNFLNSVYSTTYSTVWNGNELSEPFETFSGVKQGCLLSPLLFSLYVNDLHEYLGGGIVIDELNIRLLLYADDIVILAEEIEVLQKMIKRLEEYCDFWNLEVNLTKSKIMVFRNGGRLSHREKWLFKGEVVEIVNEYNYLGVILTPKMIFTKHVQNRNSAAKNSINATWKSFLNKNNISAKTKYQLFEAVSRAVQSYGAQIWGYTHFEEVDKLQRYFLKRILKLPNFTPNYTIMLESGLQDCHLYTLNLSLRYLNQALFKLNSSRLPHKLSLKIIEKNLFWAKKLNELGSNFDIQWQANITPLQWNENQNYLLHALQMKYHNERLQRASQTQTFYKNLNFTAAQSYFMNFDDQSYVTWIFKARCDLIQLNGSRFSRSNNQECSLCNTREIETIQHFLCRCPVLNSVRLQQFDTITISEENLANILDGELYNWEALAKYIINALRYRNYLTNEYNH